jgi:fucose permease
MDNVIYIIMYIPAVIIIEKLGMRISLMISIAISLIGVWIALMVETKEVKVFG